MASLSSSSSLNIETPPRDARESPAAFDLDIAASNQPNFSRSTWNALASQERQSMLVNLLASIRVRSETESVALFSPSQAREFLSTFSGKTELFRRPEYSRLTGLFYSLSEILPISVDDYRRLLLNCWASRATAVAIPNACDKFLAGAFMLDVPLTDTPHLIKAFCKSFVTLSSRKLIVDGLLLRLGEAISDKTFDQSLSTLCNRIRRDPEQTLLTIKNACDQFIASAPVYQQGQVLPCLSTISAAIGDFQAGICKNLWECINEISSCVTGISYRETSPRFVAQCKEIHLECLRAAEGRKWDSTKVTTLLGTLIANRVTMQKLDPSDDACHDLIVRKTMLLLAKLPLYSLDIQSLYILICESAHQVCCDFKRSRESKKFQVFQDNAVSLEALSFNITCTPIADKVFDDLDEVESHAFWSLISDLSDQDKKLLELTACNDSYEDMAKELSIGLGTVKSRLSRLRRRFEGKFPTLERDRLARNSSTATSS